MLVFVSVPQALPLQPLPDKVQETPWPLESLATLAVNFTVCPASRLCCVLGEMVTDGCGDAGVDKAATLEPPPQFVKRNMTTLISPAAFFTLTCPLPVSKSFVYSLKIV